MSQLHVKISVISSKTGYFSLKVVENKVPTPEQQGFYGNIRQQCGVECWQMKKRHFPPYAKSCQSVTLLMRLEDHGGATTAMAML